jgi:uncharacterized repeat protein (TIGR02543 family)
MKKAIKTKRYYYNAWTLIPLSLAVCFMLAACDGSAFMGRNGLIAVTIGGGSERSAVSWADTLDSNSFVHTITVSGGEGGPHSETVSAGGGTAQFSVIPGQWTITVEARLSGELLAEGSLQKQINPGNNGNVTLQMQEPASHPSFTVGFDSKGGSGVPNQTVKKYSKAAPPAPPTYDGNVFEGWYKEEAYAALYDFGAPVTAAFTLYAKWQAVTVTVPVSGVSLDKASLSLAVGESETLSATVTPSDATNKTVTWSSSDAEIASISSSGLVSAVSAGSATITVNTNDGNKTAACAVSVTSGNANQTPVAADYNITGTGTFTADGTPRPVTIQAKAGNSPGLITVYYNGSVTAPSAAGTYAITFNVAEAQGWNAAAGLSVGTLVISNAETIAVTGVSLDKTTLALSIGGFETLSATIEPSTAANKTVTWSSDSPSVASVSASGVVSALSAGNAIVTVTTQDGNHSAACAVSVSAISVTGVSISKSALTLGVGVSETLNANISPSNATNKSVFWTSGDPLIATVSGGKVTAIAEGTTSVTVTSADGGFSAVCTVTVVVITPANLAAYLATLSANSASSPHNINLIMSGASEFPTVKAALVGASNKFVYLDLTDSDITSIPDTAFYYQDDDPIPDPDGMLSGGLRQLIGITIPSGLTSIGKQAFDDCNNLASVIMPEGVISIGESAFMRCRRLASAAIPGSVTSIGNWAFNECAITSANIPSGVSIIANGVFGSCTKLASVNLPSNLASIGTAAFLSCTSLASITIPDGVTSIGDNAFGCCQSLKTINISPSNSAYTAENGALFSKDKTILLQHPTATGSYTIPSGVTSIGSYALYGCSGLTSVTIPDAVTSIGMSVIQESFSSFTLSIGSGITAIPDWSFNGCGVTSVTLAGNVTSIGNGAFSGCRSLTSINIPDSVLSVGNYAFKDCEKLASVNFGSGVKSIGDSAFYMCDSLTNIIIPNNVTSIGDNAFIFCRGLESADIGSGVTSIGKFAFSSCTKLASVIFRSEIASGGFSMEDAFLGDLRTKFYAGNAGNGTPGLYTTSNPGFSAVWTRQQ